MEAFNAMGKAIPDYPTNSAAIRRRLDSMNQAAKHDPREDPPAKSAPPFADPDTPAGYRFTIATPAARRAFAIWADGPKRRSREGWNSSETQPETDDVIVYLETIPDPPPPPPVKWTLEFSGDKPAASNPS